MKCNWFLRCDNPATTSRSHPILKEVPICARCDAKITALEKATRRPDQPGRV